MTEDEIILADGHVIRGVLVEQCGSGRAVVRVDGRDYYGETASGRARRLRREGADRARARRSTVVHR